MKNPMKKYIEAPIPNKQLMGFKKKNPTFLLQFLFFLLDLFSKNRPIHQKRPARNPRLTSAMFDPGTVPSLTQIIPAYNEAGVLNSRWKIQSDNGWWELMGYVWLLDMNGIFIGWLRGYLHGFRWSERNLCLVRGTKANGMPAVAPSLVETSGCWHQVPCVCSLNWLTILVSSVSLNYMNFLLCFPLFSSWKIPWSIIKSHGPSPWKPIGPSHSTIPWSISMKSHWSIS